MDIANGTFTLAEQHGTLTLRTAREGWVRAPATT